MKAREKEPQKETATEADKLWGEVKNLPINMYALPNQLVKNHVQRLKVNNHELYLKPKSTSVIAFLSEALGKKYTLEVAEKYLVVRRVLPDVSLPEPEDDEV